MSIRDHRRGLSGRCAFSSEQNSRLTLSEQLSIIGAMPIDTAQKQTLIQRFRSHQTDTGSPQVQVAILTERINSLADHFKAHKKDFHSRQGLLKMVSRRRRLLEYLKRNDEPSYQRVLEALKLRK